MLLNKTSRGKFEMLCPQNALLL